MRRGDAAVLMVAFVVMLAGCGDAYSLEWRFHFADATTDAQTVALLAEIRDGGCGGSPRFQTALAPDGSMASTPPTLPEGRYGFAIEARDAGCNIIARGCVDRVLPTDDARLFVELATESEPPFACSAGVTCVAGLCEGEMTPDAGSDGGTDGGTDGQADSGPRPDAGDCTGCIDAMGRCVAGDEASICGSGGGACSDCTCSGDTCDESGCTPAIAFEQVVVSSQNACALAGGRVYCWGRSDVGEVGSGGFDDARDAPVPIGVGSDYTQISATGRHTCALRSSGELQCWGANNYGQIGDETTSTGRFSPTTATITDAVEIAAGWWFTIVRRADGSVHGYGRNAEGQLANDLIAAQAIVPVQLGTDVGHTAIGAGVDHSCVVLDGSLRCAGRSTDGAFGPARGNVDILVPVGSLTNIVAVEAGHQNTCVRTSDGATYCTGCNEGQCAGALGFGVASNVFGLERHPVADLTKLSLHFHMCAIDATMALSCTGPNDDGRLGLGDTDGRMSLTRVQPGSRWIDIGAGPHSTCGVRDSGELYCWGSNANFTLGVAGLTQSEMRASPARACPR